MATEAILPDGVAEAVKPVSRGWLMGFALAWFGFWLLVMLPGQFMIVKLASVVDPAGKVALGSFLIAETAAVIVISVPIIGWLCDRSNPRFGRRRTWALAGFITAAVPFAFVSEAQSPITIAVLLAFVALGESAILVSLSAMIADQVPRNQRGRASAAMGVPQVIALAGGMVIVTELVTDVSTSWTAIGVIALLAPLPFLLVFSEPPAAAVPKRTARLTWRPELAALRGYRDFGWATLSRLAIHAGNLVGTTYLLYFLSDVLHVPDPDGSLMTLILVYLGACAVASWLGGTLSDRFRARRVFVAVSGALQAAAALTLAIVPTWNASMVAAVLLGLGFGLFLSVDQALLTDLLPSEATRSRDLGIVNAAQHLPIAPLVGWLVLGVAGYTELYLTAAIIIAFGGIIVFRVRSVR